MNGCWKHCFLAANAGLWMCTYQLQEIAWNLELSRVEVEWNLPCHRTSCCFFFKICPHPWVTGLWFDIPHSSDDSGTSYDCDDEQPAVGSRSRSNLIKWKSNAVPSQLKSRSSSTSDEAETIVDQFGWRIVYGDQEIMLRLNPQFFNCIKGIGLICFLFIFTTFFLAFWKAHTRH